MSLPFFSTQQRTADPRIHAGNQVYFALEAIESVFIFKFLAYILVHHSIDSLALIHDGILLRPPAPAALLRHATQQANLEIETAVGVPFSLTIVDQNLGAQYDVMLTQLLAVPSNAVARVQLLKQAAQRRYNVQLEQARLALEIPEAYTQDLNLPQSDHGRRLPIGTDQNTLHRYFQRTGAGLRAQH